MAIFYSDQMDKIKNTASSKYGQKVQTQELGGRQRTASFTFTVPTGNAAVNDVVNLVRLPKGAKIINGMLAFEAMSTGAADASIQIGVTGAVTKYLGTTSVDAANTTLVSFAHTIALNHGETLTAETDLIATVVTEAWLAGKKLYGTVKYVVD